MGRAHRLKQWNQIVLKPFGTALEKFAFIILRNNKNFFILNLRSQTNVTSYFTLYKSYKNYEEYLAVQQKKTKRRLEIFSQKSNSIMRTNPDQIGHISRIIKDYFKHQHISGICMGTRSGEEQVLFHKFLGNNSKVLGVELTPDAAVNPHTIIADYHYLPKELFGKFDFVYSNSHDQAYNPRLAITEWLKCLKIDSKTKRGGLLILEHSRAHGKMGAGRQDPFGVETELLPYLILTWFPNEIECVLITKALSGMPGHEILFFQKINASDFVDFSART